MIPEHAARSTQHAARSTQHAARSTQHDKARFIPQAFLISLFRPGANLFPAFCPEE